MDEFYEIVDLRTGNLLSDYPRIEDALAVLREIAERRGRAAIADLLLMRNVGDEPSVVAMDDQLIELVESYGQPPVAKAS